MKFSLFEPGSEQEDSVREILNFFFGVLAHPGHLFIVQWRVGTNVPQIFYCRSRGQRTRPCFHRCERDHGRAYTWPDIPALSAQLTPAAIPKC